MFVSTNPVIELENAIVAPFIAAATFIGSMGNIPLAIVLIGLVLRFSWNA